MVLSKTSVLVGQNLKFDLNVMGCEFHRFSNKITFKISLFWIRVPKLRHHYVNYQVEEVVSLSYLRCRNYMSFYLINHLMKLIMLQLTWKLQQGVFRINRTRSFQKGELLLDDEQYAHFLKKTIRFTTSRIKTCQFI